MLLFSTFCIKPRVYFKGGSPPIIPNPPLFLASPNLGTRFLLRVVVCNIPRIYQIWEGNFCAFVCLGWLKIHRNLKLLSLFGTFIIKSISNIYLFLEGPPWEKQNIKISISFFYSNLCKLACKGMNHKCLLFTKDCLSKTLLERVNFKMIFL
jgi:hypothetical protein